MAPLEQDGLESIRNVIQASSAKLTTGLILKGRYLIEKKLGAGGMSRVYKAVDQQKKCPVAIKQIIAIPGMDAEEIVERLKREYYFLSSVDHPNLIKAYDFFQDKNEFFLVIEFVVGVSLKDYIDTHDPIPLLERLAIGNQICRAVEVLNTAGILHRDIKPGNVMLNPEIGHIKLLDLGLGKSLKSDLATITQTGAVVGTTEYLSPEQANGTISARSDIFSLGVTLYQFFLWEKASPYKTHSTVSTMMNIITKPLPPLESKIPADVPAREKEAYRALSEMLGKAMAKDPERRLESAGLLANEMERIYHSLEESADPFNRPDDSSRSLTKSGQWRLTVALNHDQLAYLKKVGEKYGTDMEKSEEKISDEKKSGQKRATRLRKRRVIDFSNEEKKEYKIWVICGMIVGAALLFFSMGESKYRRARAAYEQAKACYEKERFKEAEQEYSRAIELDPKMAQAYHGRGLLYAEKDSKKAESDYSRAIELEPRLAQAYHARGVLYSRQNEYEKAESDYSRAIELEPRLADAYHDRGILYAVRGEQEKSSRDYARAFEIDPAIAQRHLSKLREISYGLPKEIWGNCSVAHQNNWILDMASPYWLRLSSVEQQKYAEMYQKHYAKVSRQSVEKIFDISGVTFVMRLIPPGRFRMGSPTGERGRKEDEESRNVVISKAFYISKYEISQAQWMVGTGVNPSYFKGGSLPVEKVSWKESKEFCRKNGMALPTEAQWEYACRGGVSAPFYWGVDWDRKRVNNASYWMREDVHDPVSFERSGFPEKWMSMGAGSIPVGSFSANAFGLYDMIGNVSEWCEDWYGQYGKDEVDPLGPNFGREKVCRGGSWFDFSSGLRCSARYRHYPAHETETIGLRTIFVQK